MTVSMSAYREAKARREEGAGPPRGSETAHEAGGGGSWTEGLAGLCPRNTYIVRDRGNAGFTKEVGNVIGKLRMIRIER